MTSSTTELRTPSLPAGSGRFTVLEWCVAEGDEVDLGDRLGYLASSLGVCEVTAPQDAQVLRIMVPSGSEADPQEPIAVLGPALR